MPDFSGKTVVVTGCSSGVGAAVVVEPAESVSLVVGRTLVEHRRIRRSPSPGPPVWDAGSVWINQHNALEVELPFGGVESSGFGREGGTAGVHDFLDTRVVSIKQ